MIIFCYRLQIGLKATFYTCFSNLTSFTSNRLNRIIISKEYKLLRDMYIGADYEFINECNFIIIFIFFFFFFFFLFFFFFFFVFCAVLTITISLENNSIFIDRVPYGSF